jgi:hypothetical protein
VSIGGEWFELKIVVPPFLDSRLPPRQVKIGFFHLAGLSLSASAIRTALVL